MRRTERGGGILRRTSPAAVVVVVAVANVVAACTTIGPTVTVAPKPGAAAGALEADRAGCMSRVDLALQPVAVKTNLALDRTAEEVAADNATLQRAYDTQYEACMEARGYEVAANSAATPLPNPASSTALDETDVVAADEPALTDPTSRSALDYVAPELDGLRKACPGEELVATAHAAVLPARDEARFVIFTEPRGGGCLGNLGEEDRLMLEEDGRWRSVIQGSSLAITRNSHNGARDIVDTGHGGCRTLYQWTGSTYARVPGSNCA